MVKHYVSVEVDKSKLPYGRGVTLKQAQDEFVKGFMEAAKKNPGKYVGIKAIEFKFK